MDISRKILSDIVHYMKYAKYDQVKNRREFYNETVDRVEMMHLKKFKNNKQIVHEIQEVFKNFIQTKKVLPSMRSMQFAGKPMEVNPVRGFNCSYLPVDDYRAFGEIMFLLLSGVGVGFSVQTHHVEKLPPINKGTRNRRYLIGDSIEGWSDAIKTLMKSYLFGKPIPIFDYNEIRPKGSRLVTSGGKAPGPEPLKDAIHNITKILERKNNGEQLTSLEVYDIICFIADAVLAGGIRRSATIALYSWDDLEMHNAKIGNWWELNPQRGRSNNSVVAIRGKITRESFMQFWERIAANKTGDPGIIFSNDKEYGFNPCVEASLRPFTFCNLTSINGSEIHSQEDFNSAAKAATLIGTIQASYTDFHYLRDVWKRNTEKDSLIGVSITGLANKIFDKIDFKEAAKIVVSENKRISQLLGIKSAARTTLIKPEGTSSIVLGTASGIHSWYDKYWIRRIRVGKDEAMYSFILKNYPELVEDDFFRPDKQAVISMPQDAPKGAILRTTETLEEFLNRILRVNKEWIHPGHNRGVNKHNASATVYLKDDEWEWFGEWLYENKESFSALSFLPFDPKEYKQAPFESINEEQYNEMFSNLSDFSLDGIVEEEDNTDLHGEIACGGGACEIT